MIVWLWFSECKEGLLPDREYWEPYQLISWRCGPVSSWRGCWRTDRGNGCRGLWFPRLQKQIRIKCNVAILNGTQNVWGKALKSAILWKAVPAITGQEIPNVSFSTKHNTNEYLLQRCNRESSLRKKTNKGSVLLLAAFTLGRNKGFCMAWKAQKCGTPSGTLKVERSTYKLSSRTQHKYCKSLGVVCGTRRGFILTVWEQRRLFYCWEGKRGIWGKLEGNQGNVMRRAEVNNS